MTQNESSQRKIEDTLTGILAMENIQRKADELISDIQKREHILSLLERDLDSEKIKLQKIHRLEENITENLG